VSLGDIAIQTSDKNGLKPYANALLFQVSSRYRLTPYLSLGGVASYAPGVESDADFWRAAGEARLHAGLHRIIDAWAAAEVGLAISKYSAQTQPDSPPPSARQLAARVAPLAGAGLGLDLFPLPFAAVGLEGRALAPVFLAKAATSETPSGVTAAFLIALTITARFGGGER
jgi:hypothetical protein